MIEELKVSFSYDGPSLIVIALKIVDFFPSAGGYKEEGKYVYHYEAFLNPAKIPNLESHIAKLHINGTVEMHIKRNEKAILKVYHLNQLSFALGID